MLLPFSCSDAGWVHVNCALWSSEVYEEVDGSLQNVGQALSRGSRLLCSFCRSKGASVGCCHDNCKSNYHFACGVKDGAAFKNNKGLYCRYHKDLYDDIEDNDEGFTVMRTVHVDVEKENQSRKSKPVDLRNIKLSIGALRVECIGHPVQSMLESGAPLIPEGFSCSRVYWSAKNPAKMTTYRCTTRLAAPLNSGKAAAIGHHLVVSHNDLSSSEANARMARFRRKLRKMEVAKVNLENFDFVPPYAVKRLWRHLTLKDLHVEEDSPREEEAAVSLQADIAHDEIQIVKTPERVAAQNSSAAADANLFPRDLSATATAASEDLSPTTKRLNKAVGNVLRRATPNKYGPSSGHASANVDDDFDLALDDNEIPLEASDADLISAILRDGNFEEELELGNPVAAMRASPLQDSSPQNNWSGQLMTVSEFLASSGMDLERLQSLCGGVSLKLSDRIPVLDEANYKKMIGNAKEPSSGSSSTSGPCEEVVVVRTWFNQNKRKKYSEVTIQCTLPYERTNFEMDDDCSAFDNEEAAEENNPVASRSIVGELNEIDIINKILALSGDKILEMGGGDASGDCPEVTFSFPASELTRSPSTSSLKDPTQLPDPVADGTVDLLKGRLADFSSSDFVQLDGANDELDESDKDKAKKPQIIKFAKRDDASAKDVEKEIPQLEVQGVCLMCEKCGQISDSEAIHQSHILACPDVVTTLTGFAEKARLAKKQEKEIAPEASETKSSSGKVVEPTCQESKSEDRKRKSSGTKNVSEGQKSIKLEPTASSLTDTPSTSTDTSPRKDFSIAGLLSPQQEAEMKKKKGLINKGEKEKPKAIPIPDDDDDVVILPSPSPKRSSPKKPPAPLSPQRRLLPKPNLSPGAGTMTGVAPQSAPSQSVAQPIYVQQMIPEMAAAAAAAAANPFATLAGFQSGIQFNQPMLQTFPGASAGYPIIQTAPPQFQLTPQGLIQTQPPQQFGYLTPQGIIVNQPTTAAPGFYPAASPFAPGTAGAGQIIYSPQPPPQPATYLPAATPGYPMSPLPMQTRPLITPTSIPTPIPPPPPTPHTPLPTPSTSSAPHITPPQQKKIARVQPQPSKVVRPLATKPKTPTLPTPSPSTSASSASPRPSSSSSSSRIDPIKALSSMANQPMSITHRPGQPPPQAHPESAGEIDVGSRAVDKQRSVGTQAKIGGPLKILTPRPWKGSESTNTPTPPMSVPLPSTSAECGSAGSSVVALNSRPPSIAPIDDPSAGPSAACSRSSTPKSNLALEHSYAVPSSPSTAAEDDADDVRFSSEGGVTFKTKRSKSSSIKFTLQKDRTGEGLKVQEIAVKDGSKKASSSAAPKFGPQTAITALNLKSRVPKRQARQRKAAFVAKLDINGCVPLTEDDFVNEQEGNMEDPSSTDGPDSFSYRADPASEEHIVYEVTADDGGFHAVSADASELWRQVFEAVQAARASHGMRPLPLNPLGEMGMQMMGLAHSALSFLLRQMPAARATDADKPKIPKRAGEESDSDSEDESAVGKKEPTQVLRETKSGSVRSEPFRSRAPLDMFSWLASRHRTVPHPGDRPRGERDAAAEMEMQLSSSNRRATSLDLPMAMRFRDLAKNAKEAVGVFRSRIHGRGLYCKREIQSGEMVIEYAGEEIRAVLTDKREKYYEGKGIGCYMFKIDDDTVVDATMKGNAARFINHSCDVSILFNCLLLIWVPYFFLFSLQPNCYSKIVDIRGKKHIIIFAMKKIIPGEELTYDYKFPIEDVKLPCSCGTKKCRKYMN